MVEKRMISYRKSRWITCLFFVVLLAISALHVQAASGVFDKAGLFTSEEIAQMEELSAELASEYRMHFLILTVDDANGRESYEVAEDFYEKNGYVDSEERGGIVLLIDMDNREINLVTSGDMIYYITDEREERVYDAGYGYVSEGEYGAGMLSMLSSVLWYIQEGIPSNQYIYDTETGRIIRYRSLSAGDLIIAFAAAFFSALLTCFGVSRRYNVVKKYEYTLGQNAHIKLKGQNDRLINQFETSRRIPRPTPSGGSGGGGSSSSGRSSTHRSSGGHSYGGGHGRKF